MRAIHEAVAERLLQRVQQGWLWHGRKVRVVDGTGINLPDTRLNQAAFPQSAAQLPGCGFPVMQVVACFCLHSGALLHWVSTKLSEHESPLLPKLLPFLQAGEVLLTDRGYCSYSNLALCRQKGIVRVPIQVRGFRVRTLWIVTTLTDPKLYPKDDLAELYRRRWQAELCLRDIKTTMAMEQLRCKSPAMVARELRLFIIAYNLLRMLIAESAIIFDYHPYQISFKAAADTLRQYRKAFRTCRASPRKLKRILGHLLRSIARVSPSRRYKGKKPLKHALT